MLKRPGAVLWFSKRRLAYFVVSDNSDEISLRRDGDYELRFVGTLPQVLRLHGQGQRVVVPNVELLLITAS